MDSPLPVVVVLGVSTFVEAVGDARLLALRGVVVALVSAGGAMGGGVNDGPAGCSGSDADGVGVVVVSSSRLVSSRVSVTLMAGRRRRCFWVWVQVWEVFGLLLALRAGFLAGADDHRLAEGDVAGGVSAGVAAGFRCRCGVGCGAGGWRRRWVA